MNTVFENTRRRRDAALARKRRQAVEKNYRKRDTGDILNRPSLEPAVQRWMDLVAAAKAAKEAADAAAEVIKAAIGDATELDAGAYTLSYKLTVREEYVVPASRFRVLRVVEDNNLEGGE